MSLRKQIPTLLPELMAYAMALSKNPTVAADLSQEAIKKSLTAKNAPPNLKDLRPWMFRIIRNIHIDNLRKEKTQREYLSSHARLSNEDTGHPSVINEIIIKQALTEITEPEREIVYLIDILGLKYSEAAQVLDVPEGTIMSRISRARRSLLQKIETTNVMPFKKIVKRNDNK